MRAGGTTHDPIHLRPVVLNRGILAVQKEDAKGHKIK
jgi:hypothetical protein